jgi:hypothetical protein
VVGGGTTPYHPHVCTAFQPENIFLKGVLRRTGIKIILEKLTKHINNFKQILFIWKPQNCTRPLICNPNQMHLLMKHSLERLDDLVHDVINNRYEILSENHPLFNWHKVFKRENENVKKYMRRRCLKLADKQKISAFVDQCHTEVIALSDFVYLEDSNILLKAENENSLSVMKGLQRLLAFINYHFREYLNTESKLPLYEVDIVQRQFELEYKRIRKKLIGAEDENLLNHLFLHLRELTIPKEKLTSNIKYLRFFIEQLKEFTAQRENLAYDNYSLVDFLIAMNFNTSQLFLHVTRNIKSNVEKQDSLPEKLNVLALAQKELRQGIELSYIKLYSKAATTKELVVNWINEEITAIGGASRTEIKTLPEVKSKKKMNLLISVDVLATLVMAAKEAKVISGSDKMIAAFVSQYFETISGISPSEKSFLNKLYQTGGKAKAEEILEEMLKVVKRL